MTMYEIMQLGKAPVALNDGNMGIVISYGNFEDVGIQVPGEDDIRWIKVATLIDVGDGALIEVIGGVGHEAQNQQG